MLSVLVLSVIIGVSFAGFHMPPFSWDTPPVFIHMCNASGPFNDSTIEFLTRFPMVTIEKGQGINATIEPYASQYVEDKILDTLRKIKEINSSIVTIMYLNSILDWTFYRLHQEFIENPDWWLRDMYDDLILISGDKNFPQPEQGMLVFDFQQESVQKLFSQACLNMTNSGYIDGCFADRPEQATFGDYNLTQNQTKYFSAGHTQTLLDIQKGLNDTNKSVLVSNGWAPDGIVAVQMEGFSATQKSIQQLQQYAQKGILVQAHAGYAQNGDDNHCQDITNSLGAFLIGAEKYSYYGCSRGWYIEPDWIVWHSQYDKPLGAPNGVAVLNGDIYIRSFASGTKVTFNITSNISTISWAN